MDRRRLTPIRDELVVIRNTVVSLASDCSHGGISDRAHSHTLREIADHLDQSYELLVRVAIKAADDEAQAALYPDETALR